MLSDEHKGMSEAEAHRMIEKTAMDTRRDRAEVAAEILEESNANAAGAKTCRIFSAYFQLIVVYCIYGNTA